MVSKVLGLWSGHDTSFCLLTNGVVEMHTELERHSRLKEDTCDSISLFKQHYGDMTNITHIATCLQSSIDKYQENYRFITQTGLPIYQCGHHQAHAAHAFYSSKFDEATILTLDGGGMESGNIVASTTIWKGVDKKIQCLKVIPTSKINLGGIWTRLTNHIFGYESGYPYGHQAGTVMALAALGKSTKYFDDFRKFLREDLNNACSRAPGHVKYTSVKDANYPRHPFLGKWHDIAKVNEQEKFDMALALQTATEEQIKELIDKSLQLNLSNNLCIAGGVALNSVAMGKIRDWYPNLNVFIPPVPYDGGLTIGAAQYVWHHILENNRVNWNDNPSPYLGKKYTRDEIMSALMEYKFNIEQVTDDDVIELLISGQIVSIFNGSAESGRRALGNRSILADPRQKDMKDKINEKVKHRQWFRPFAPSLTIESMNLLFDNPQESPYMGFVCRFKEEIKDKVPAVVHFDGTARLQTVTANDNPWYHGFLTKWGIKTGYPIILNTSFNDREPICETPSHAIKCFINTDIDAMFFPEYGILVRK